VKVKIFGVQVPVTSVWSEHGTAVPTATGLALMHAGVNCFVALSDDTEAPLGVKLNAVEFAASPTLVTVQVPLVVE
jgi:hypothetical protein